MKRIIKRFWGLAFVLVLLSTLFVGALPQAAAGALSFTADISPTITTTSSITEFVVAADTTTIYAINSANVVIKSVNAGRTWAATGAIGHQVEMIAVAPDNPAFVAVLSPSGNASMSRDGGATWAYLGKVRDSLGNVAANVSSIDIAPTVGGVTKIAVGGCYKPAGHPNKYFLPALYYLDFGLTLPSWKNAMTEAPFSVAANFSAANVTRAIKFSPNYLADYQMYFLTDNGLTANISVISFNHNKFNNSIPTYTAIQGYMGSGFAIHAAMSAGTASNITKASIVFDPNFYGYDESTRIAYVATRTIATTGNVTKLSFAAGVVRAAALGVIGAAPYSIALNAAGTGIVAGTFGSNLVQYASTTTGAWTASRALKSIGINAGVANGLWGVVVGWSGANVVAASSGTSGAFGLSTDNGFTFNDISYVRSAFTNITDYAISADGTKRYVASDDNAVSSIYKYTGTYWERIYTLNNLKKWLVKPSPATWDVVYLGSTIDCDIWYTESGGNSNWQPRTAAVGAIVGAAAMSDLAVESDTTIYAAVNPVGGGVGIVTRATMKGYLWDTSVSPFPATFANRFVSSLTMVGTGKVIAGSAAGGVAYTTNSGVSWTAYLLTGGVGVAYTAATDLVAGSIIYAICNSDANVYTYTIGTSTAGTGTLVGAALATGNSTAIALGPDAIYRLGIPCATGPAQVTYLSRSLYGAVLNFQSVVTAGATLNPVSANVSNAMYVFTGATGNSVIFGDSNAAPAASARFYTYTDTLTTAASNPTLTGPVDNAIVQVNNQTGLAYNVMLSFSTVTGVTTAQIQIAYDALFTQPVGAVVGLVPVAGTVNQWVGPAGGIGTAIVNFLPGQKYYWRVQGTTPFLTGFSAVRSFIIEPGQAMVPSLNAPSNGDSVNTVNPSFSWSPIGGCTMYSFQIATNVTFSTGTVKYTVNPTAAGASIPSTMQLNRGSTYYWRVKALQPVEGDWSTVGNFIVAELPPATSPPVTITQTSAPAISLTVTIPPAPAATSVVIPPATTIVQTTTQITTTQVTEEKVVNPSYIWAIIIIGAVLVIAVIVLIVRTRRTV